MNSKLYDTASFMFWRSYFTRNNVSENEFLDLDIDVSLSVCGRGDVKT